MKTYTVKDAFKEMKIGVQLPSWPAGKNVVISELSKTELKELHTMKPEYWDKYIDVTEGKKTKAADNAG